MSNPVDEPPAGREGRRMIHATAVAVAVDRDGPLAGALLLGASGSGKSSLALGLIEECRWGRTALVADDQVVLTAAGSGICASAPGPLAGLIEVRGFGPLRVRAAAAAQICAAFDLAASAGRLTEPGSFRLADGASVPLFPFVAREQHVAAVARFRFVLRAIINGQI